MVKKNPLQKVTSIMGPGLLVAATGVGAGDLATAAFTGISVGTSILWVVLLGALIKFVLNNELARFQIKTGDTLLEGMLKILPKPLKWVLMTYFILWSYLVAIALMSACGVVTYAIFPLNLSPSQGKVIYGAVYSLLGFFLIRKGGYQMFERIMRFCIAGMFFAILFTASQMTIKGSDIIQGLTTPVFPDDPQKLAWALALMGGVGGTVTVLNYGYWLRETRRDQKAFQVNNTWDIGISYLATAAFSIAMVIIGSQISVDGKGSTLIVRIAEALDTQFLPFVKWVFLIGAWATVFSSLLGVWQGVPYLFVDLIKSLRKETVPHKTYNRYLAAMAFIPLSGLWLGFARMQQLYSLIGAIFMPILATTLLALFFTDKRLTPLTTYDKLLVIIFLLILGFFVWIGVIM